MPEHLYREVSDCRHCGAELAGPVLDYGIAPVADALSETPGDTSYQAPLALYYCPECALVQLGCHLAPKAIFNSEYPYFSSSIHSLVTRMEELAGELISRYELSEHSSVLEIASNDGYLLQHFKRAGIPCSGIEPSTRQVKAANRQGIPTLKAFFSRSVAEDYLGSRPPADLVIANNVIAHVPEINDFIAGLARVLNDTGTLVAEIHYLADLLKFSQFDTVYHQHIFYYSLTALDRVMRSHGLVIYHVEHIDVYGGSIRVYAGKARDKQDSVEQLLAQEEHSGLAAGGALKIFADKAIRSSQRLSKLVKELKQAGHSIAAYGAAAKSSTLLHLCDLSGDQLDYVVDHSPYKQGRYLPCTDIVVSPVDRLNTDTPDYLLVLAWNYAEEIKQQLAWFETQGGRFIVPPMMGEHGA